ncbi:hypothetical protein LV457_18690 [Mycobacterium sp. MYCO198283]|uniref:hypothetical protein n=1 Tax=Mycobacterium sp. MYCO198283 TaxID=2883505 RepID=UPI001E64ADB9|nr:hypothetical protein [Mycobacterium sp. MYCO198283]MCG5434303.1 hypothetical protein [Mycobacterium sp. MYCO198283]
MSADEDRLDELRRWEDSGAHWRVVTSTPDRVTIALLTCDGGEEVGRFTTDDVRVLAYVTRSNG